MSEYVGDTTIYPDIQISISGYPIWVIPRVIEHYPVSRYPEIQIFSILEKVEILIF
jgi:hypothetical protein